MAGNNRLRPQECSDKRLKYIWRGFIVLGTALFLALVFQVFSYKKDKFYYYLVPKSVTTPVTPERGDIFDCKGRIIATSTILYDIHLDTAAPADSVWDRNAVALAGAMAGYFKDKSKSEYNASLQQARKKRNRFFLLKKDINLLDVYEMRKMPLLREGRYKGGYLESSRQERKYPYGTSARRTIGYVKSNNDTVRMIGIEGSFDSYLHGEDGKQMMSRSDYGMTPVGGKDNVKATNGDDITLTLDIDIQNIADKALRSGVERSDYIEKSCVIVLETATGAVKAMVNLGRDREGHISERENYAISNAEAPGSIFKGAVLMAMLEEGYLTSIEDSIPTYRGSWKYKGEVFNDTKHVGPKRFPGGYIKVREAFEMSANNPFRQMICDTETFGSNPQRFIDKIKGFGLIDTIDFDIKGNVPPSILTPDDTVGKGMGTWGNGIFPRMAIGYNMILSPLNIITFYNAIANGGKVMKPYLVQTISRNGRVKEHFEPIVLHRRICSQRTADTLKRAMVQVTTSKGGTAYWQFRGAACTTAGKTGTAQRLFKMSNGKDGYHDFATGYESQQGSFVGFFPAENPEYTAIVVIWSKPAPNNFYGASYAGPVFREIADKIYCLHENK